MEARGKLTILTTFFPLWISVRIPALPFRLCSCQKLKTTNFNMSFSILNHPQAPEVHASTLLIHKDQLLSAWFGGTKEGHPDTKIWFSTRNLVGDDAAWEPPRVVASRDGLAHWNPVLFHVPEMERIMLFFKVGSPISSWWTCVQETRDGGRTWGEARELVPGDRGTDDICIVVINIDARYRRTRSGEEQMYLPIEWDHHRACLFGNAGWSVAVFH
jgi:hypothetical protein